MLEDNSSPVEEENGDKPNSQVLGKSVKISIRDQLQAFRRNHGESSKNATKPQNRVQVLSKHQKVIPAKVENDSVKEVESASGDIITETIELSEPEDNSPKSLNASQLENSQMDDLNVIEVENKMGGEAPSAGNQSGEEGKGEERITDKEKDNVIRPIDRGVVHQICSGQVIVTLSTAVKELVENSLDAGATKIDIRLQEYGSRLIEVTDNGSGIEEVNFEGLALKHHTSKISEFEDLTGISTFGFRGEALSSLCALSKLTVTTRHKSSGQKLGYKIDYDNYGRIASKTPCARECGTTVILRDVFHTLPVRHREFLKNLKREFHRMVNILYGYCLVVNGTRISCTNQVGNQAPTKVIAVPSYNTMKERIVALFGSKQFSSLLEIKQCNTVPEEILSEFGLTEQSFQSKYKITGYISVPNQGRSSNDRQFFFINSRPCDPAKISRVINEVYHSFSRSQNPFVCLHIETSREDVDVNVTPDKRTLYVQNEKILLATLKASLIPLLTDAASSYNPSCSQISSQSQLQLNFTGKPPTTNAEHDDAINLSPSSSFKIRMQADSEESSSQQSLYSQQSSFARQYSSSFAKGSKTKCFYTNDDDRNPTLTPIKRQREREVCSRDVSKIPKLTGFFRRFEASEKRSMKLGGNMVIEEVKVDEDEGLQVKSNDGKYLKSDSASVIDLDKDDIELGSQSQPISPNESEREGEVEEESAVVAYDDEVECEDTEEISGKISRVSVNWKEISAKLAKMKVQNETSHSVNYARRFRAKISPEDNTAAEEELKKQLTQDMFCKMEIVGQFNLGFIIVKNGPDLFIVDQHASDEKFNYEDLEKSTIMQGQLLISPLDLQLPAISENIIMDNIEVFQRNGFDFTISPDETPTRRVKLSKIPYSKNTEFGKSDIEELIFMMEDAADKSFYRPTKVRQMLASRACRKSVMIGNALSPKEMRMIVDHMGSMLQPWNCPHGRPTIRHLINLNLLPDLNCTEFVH